jgi:hypothetical protein
MQLKKISSTAIIALFLIAVLTTGFTGHRTPTGGSPITITAVYDFSTFPDVLGTFTTSGALNISGTTEMIVGPNQNGVRAHCVVFLRTSAGNITIHQECQFSSPIPRGSWQIVSGTGAYSNLKGNGSLTMPPDTELMEGSIR